MDAGDQPFRQQTNQREIDRADEGQTLQNLADMFAGGASRPDARNETAILAHVVRELGRVEDDADIEEREQNDQDDVNQVIERLAEGDNLAEIFDERVLGAEHQRRRAAPPHHRPLRNPPVYTPRIYA